MSELAEFVISHADRGPCVCGRCLDALKDPAAHQPQGHTADVVFFKASTKGSPDPDALRELCRAHRGEFNEVNPFDGNEHSYIELGGWVGDQGLALMLMGLGALLGLWQLVTPRTLLGADEISSEQEVWLAQSGMLWIMMKRGDRQAEPSAAPAPSEAA